MSFVKKISAAAISAVIILILMCGCSSSEETQNLEADIVGMWIDEDGPETVDNQYFGNSLIFYEFTSDKTIYYHFVYLDDNGNAMDGSIESGTYRIDDNMLVYESDNSGAVIDITDGTMTLTNNSGASKFTKLSVAEVAGYSVYYFDTDLRTEEDNLIALNEAMSSENAESVSADETSETEADETEENGSGETETEE